MSAAALTSPPGATDPHPLGWVADELGLTVQLAGGQPLAAFEALAGLALRRNPRRAHLLVSRVLGKHLPVDPAVALAAARELATRVLDEAGEAPGGFVVLGFAETATALGQAVAAALPGADCLLSTRRPGSATIAFEEEHSHASAHRVLAPQEMLSPERTVVLVDDELSSGRTAVNTIRALHRRAPHPGYVVAALLDMRPAAARREFASLSGELGVPVHAVSLLRGELQLAGDAPQRVAPTLASADPPQPLGTRFPAQRLEAGWSGVRLGARHGWTEADERALAAAVDRLAGELAGSVGLSRGRLLVLGTEELMYAPLVLAAELGRRLPGVAVRYQSTTRSPVAPLDREGYAVRCALEFAAPDEPWRTSFVYNVRPGAADHIVVVTDGGATGPMVDALRSCAPVTEVLLHDEIGASEPVLVPLGSYQPADVTFLLKDLGEVAIERPTEEREELIQSGTHYAEMLPVEYQPPAAYVELFEAALDRSAPRLAVAVGVVAELIRAQKPAPVLVSLARAGTPIGVLLRRWLMWRHGLDAPHYSVSIVRGRGIDQVAMRWLLRRHDPASLQFVDGWTGKGAITRELTEAVVPLGLDDTLAVLADPGRCVPVFGTRDDFLIPSACLNSTVSGLVSRTVLNDRLIGPHDFHGAKMYRELAGGDVSRRYIETVVAAFPAVAAEVEASWPVLAATDREPTWAGWREVEAVAAEFGIRDLNLVKPGVGETTRVLLRRVPDRILVTPGREDDLQHVLVLAAERGVPVEKREGLTFSCIGVIKPRGDG